MKRDWNIQRESLSAMNGKETGVGRRKENPVGESEGFAPGCLDLLGGVGAWGGSLVVSLGLQSGARVKVEPLAAEVLRVISTAHGTAEVELASVRRAWEHRASAVVVRGLWGEAGAPQWARKIFEVLGELVAMGGKLPLGGCEIRVDCDLPTGAGVGEDPAVLLATAEALADYTGVPLTESSKVHLFEKWKLSPAGAMVDLVGLWGACHGKAGDILPIDSCSRAIRSPIGMPTGILWVGWPCGVGQTAGPERLARARTAAFMGHRMLEMAIGRESEYLAGFSPKEFHPHQEHLPVAMKGEDFLDAWKLVDDPQVVVEAETVYPVRAATRFVIEENDRAERTLAALELLEAGEDESVLWQVGGHLYASHAGYGAMGLGGTETDLMVSALRAAPLDSGIYGGRISGAGLGGTVVVMLKESALPLLETWVQRLTPGQKLLF